ncbi:hypothetical protein BDR05DRAFT_961348 [Suillus weaverae]|nr:hypothetical protein BDR05DRAFT_769396 [Suillus weaverae]KAG2344921.1 hypothetical protein BDR05DRAFT_961348 [Suillus weaverae]
MMNIPLTAIRRNVYARYFKFARLSSRDDTIMGPAIPLFAYMSSRVMASGYCDVCRPLTLVAVFVALVPSTNRPSKSQGVTRLLSSFITRFDQWRLLSISTANLLYR